MTVPLLHEIREGFANLPSGSQVPLRELPTAWPGWIYREGTAYGAAVELDCEIDLNERFAGARLTTRQVTRGNHIVRELRLECRREHLRNEFAVICAQLLDPGENGASRSALASDPARWWANWRDLLGNAIRNRATHDVLGELLALEKLVVDGADPHWAGPGAGSHDIETRSVDYEVKSTLSRYRAEIHVAGQFQLVRADGKRLFLVHQRFEPSQQGDSIESVRRRLVNRGIPEEFLERALENLGLGTGSQARQKRYKLIESRMFEVDDAFPRVTPDSFVNGVMPIGIVSLQYVVDLDTVPCLEFIIIPRRDSSHQ